MSVQVFYGTSNTVRCFTYDPTTKDMVITFAGGRICEYVDIPQTVAWGFRGADDKGDFYRSRVRNRFRPVATYY